MGDISLIQAITGGSGTRMAEVSAVSTTSKYRRLEPIKSGYYMFDNRGRLCTGKHFHKVNTTLGRKQFNGTYYFGGQNGSPVPEEQAGSLSTEEVPTCT